MTTIEIHSDSPVRTRQIGRSIGAALIAGDVVALVGPLGAGKTQLAKGLASGLGVADERVVASPTYVLVHEYAGRIPVFHLDLYRLPMPVDLSALGFDEMCAGESVVIVEWADRAEAAISATAIWIELSLIDENNRRMQLRMTRDELGQRVREALRIAPLA